MNATLDNKENLDAENYFLLAARAWNSQAEDYTTMEDAGTSIKYFKNYPDAEELYQQGGLSVFPDLKGTGMSGEEFTKRCLEEAGVAMIPGTAFGKFAIDNVRLNFATSRDNISKAIEKIDKILK